MLIKKANIGVIGCKVVKKGGHLVTNQCRKGDLLTGACPYTGQWECALHPTPLRLRCLVLNYGVLFFFCFVFFFLPRRLVWPWFYQLTSIVWPWIFCSALFIGLHKILIIWERIFLVSSQSNPGFGFIMYHCCILLLKRIYMSRTYWQNLLVSGYIM